MRRVGLRREEGATVAARDPAGSGRARSTRLLTRVALGGLAALLAVIVTFLPAAAGSEPPEIRAINNGGPGGAEHRWSPEGATVGEEGLVKFSNPSPGTAHGVKWLGGNPELPSCSAGVDENVAGHEESGTEWSGTCTFKKTGSYNFYCTVHGAEMTGKITVSPNGTVTTSMPGMTTTTSSSPTSGSGPANEHESASGPTTPPVGGGAPPGSLLRSLRLARTQHGSSVHAQVSLSHSAAGGRLEVELFAGSAGRASGARAPGALVGRLVRRHAKAGSVSFAVPLNGTGRRALHRHHELSITVEVVLRPRHGSSASVDGHVVLHG
jgi:plastocyanin